VGGGGKASNAATQKGKTQEGYTLEYKVKRRIPLENISEIKMRYVGRETVLHFDGVFFR
jgi:hypothetical protein